MRLRAILFSIMLCTVVSACGLKRNLELPGNEKHKAESADQTQVVPTFQPPTPMPAPISSGGS